MFNHEHYVALFYMFLNYTRPWNALWRYLTGRGEYPYIIEIKTPTGNVRPVLYSHHDLLTVNEIFCRQDYSAGKNIKVVTDFGSNIGLSALYFLSRNTFSKCFLFEPDQRNILKLTKTLLGYEKRYILFKNAVSNIAGEFEFGIEETGRYGGLDVATGQSIKVTCLAVNDVLQKIFDNENFIDILKIDTEGIEVVTVLDIKSEYLKKIKIIYLEAYPTQLLHPTYFNQYQYGGICQLIAKESTN